MTTHTPAPAPQDFIATELRGIIDVCGDSPTAIVSVERMRLWLSKLRAPVADERAMDEAWNMAKAAAINDYGTDTLAHRYLFRAALDSVPQAGERINDDTLWSWAEQIMGGKEAHHVGRDRVLRFARAALASAPVAGEAQEPIGFVDPVYVAGRQRGMKWNAKIYDAPTQEATAPLYAAPQASEAVGIEEAFAGLDDRLDAARWRMAVGLWRVKRVEVFDGVHLSHTSGIPWEDLTRQIDAALSAQPGANK